MYIEGCKEYQLRVCSSRGSKEYCPREFSTRRMERILDPRNVVLEEKKYTTLGKCCIRRNVARVRGTQG